MPKRATTTASALDHHQLLAALRAFQMGDFSARLPIGPTGIDGEIIEAFNDVLLLSERMSKEFERLGEMVGKYGRARHRAHLPNAAGSWAGSIEAVNRLVDDLVQPTAEMARVISAVAKGDLSQRMNIEIEVESTARSSCASAKSSTPWWTSSTPSRRR